MTSKIFRSTVFVAALVLLSSLSVILGVLYNHFTDVQVAQLKDELSLAVTGTEQYGNAFLENVEADRFRVTWIDADGTVIQEIYCYIAGMYTVPFNLYMYGQRATLSTGVNKASAIWFNSLHYDAENAILFWSAFEEDKDNSVTLYAIDEMNDFAVYNLGQFG
jgi:hypothetical protein